MFHTVWGCPYLRVRSTKQNKDGAQASRWNLRCRDQYKI